MNLGMNAGKEISQKLDQMYDHPARIVDNNYPYIIRYILVVRLHTLARVLHY